MGHEPDRLTLNNRSQYDYVIFYPESLLEAEYPVSILVSEFLGLKKNIVSYSKAMEFWKRQGLTQGIQYTNDDIQHAYDLAYGGGIEWEWKYE